MTFQISAASWDKIHKHLSLCGPSHIQTVAATLVLDPAQEQRSVNFVISQAQLHISGSMLQWGIFSKLLSWSGKWGQKSGHFVGLVPSSGEIMRAPDILRQGFLRVQTSQLVMQAKVTVAWLGALI